MEMTSHVPLMFSRINPRGFGNSISISGALHRRSRYIYRRVAEECEFVSGNDGGQVEIEFRASPAHNCIEEGIPLQEVPAAINLTRFSQASATYLTESECPIRQNSNFNPR